jgi:hypothetical protein
MEDQHLKNNIAFLIVEVISLFTPLLTAYFRPRAESTINIRAQCVAPFQKKLK